MEVTLLPDGSHQAETACTVCRKQILWRQPSTDASWFCTVCGTRETDADEESAAPMSRVGTRRVGRVAVALVSICIIAAGILWASIVRPSQHASSTEAAIQSTSTTTPESSPTQTSIPPTATPADANLPPAQQLAYLQLGHAVSPKRAIVAGFSRDLHAIQSMCGQHQFQIEADVVDLWHQIRALGKHDTLAQVSRGYTQEMQAYMLSGAGQPDCLGEADLYRQMRA